MFISSHASSIRAHHVLWLAALGLILTFGLSARATTVIPPDFDSLVQQADYVVRGTVKSAASEWREQNGHRNIVTFITIDVTDTIAGTPPSPLVLQMLGGKIGDKQLTVQGAPVFTIGAEYILFVRGNGVQFNPLVALMHGQYPITKDTSGRSIVTRSDGSPLTSKKDVATPIDTHARASTAPQTAASEPAPAALTSAEFAALIRASRHNSAAAARP